MTQQTPEQPAPNSPPAPAAPTPQAPAMPETGKQPPWGDDANFNPEEAWKTIQNLRKEKGGPDPQLRSELDALKAQQQTQRDALAKALGIAPEETSSADKLAQQVSELQEQFAATRLQAAVLTAAQNNGIPAEFQGWLTATEPDALDAQAKQLMPMVQATLASRGQSPLMPGPMAPGAPAFAPNPGQGQGGGALTPEAQAAAEYEKYYPTPR